MSEFKFFFNKEKKDNKLATLDFRRANFILFREDSLEYRCKFGSEGLGIHKCWPVFRKYFLEPQEQAIPQCLKSNNQGRQSAWLNRGSL